MELSKKSAPSGAKELEECALWQIFCRHSGAYVSCTREPTADAMGYGLTALRAFGVHHSRQLQSGNQSEILNVPSHSAIPRMDIAARSR